jgi:tetratricopeptide (TPR) repeat protein
MAKYRGRRSAYSGPPQQPEWSQRAPGDYSSRRQGRPLPLWSKGSIVIGITLALVAAFLTRAFLQHGDWTDGMLAVSLAAGLLAVVTLLVGITRVLALRRGRSTVLQTLMLMVSLSTIATGSFAAAPLLHRAQAENAQRQGQWAEAAAEFALGGEHAPNAPGIAGALVAWGEHELAQKHYANAADKLVAVVITYAGSGHGIVSQAWRDLYRTYSAWIPTNAGDVTYGGDGGALAAFQRYLADPACDAACQTQMQPVLAQAYFRYGQQLMTRQQYTEAKAQFETVIRQYPSSVYASQARTAAATAYLALGKQQITAHNCSGAVESYRTLVTRFSGTPEAATAQTALHAPQPVSGTFSGLPANPAPTVALSLHVDVSGFFFSDDYTATPDASGAFSLPSVAQGNYNLSTRRDVNNNVSYTYYHDNKGNLFTVHVGPLCPVQLGTIAFKA